MVCDCLQVTQAESSHQDRGHMVCKAENIYCPALYRKSVLPCGLKQRSGGPQGHHMSDTEGELQQRWYLHEAEETFQIWQRC